MIRPHLPRLLALMITWCLGASAAVGTAPPEAAPTEARTIFRHVNVLPMDRDVVLSDQDVVVERGRIVSVRPASAKPARGARQIDGHGRFLMPGLVDFHTHPQAPDELELYPFYGVTTIASLDGELLDWRRKGSRLPASGASIISSTHILDGAEAADAHYAVDSSSDVAAILDHEVGSGAEMVKSYTRMTLPEFSALARGAHERGLPLIGHVPLGVPIAQVFVGGLDLVAHSEQFTRYLTWQSTDSDFDSIVRTVASNRVGVIVNLAVLKNIEPHTLHLPDVLRKGEAGPLYPTAYQAWLPRNNIYPNRPNIAEALQRTRAQYAIMRSLVRRLADAGVLLLLGTDAPVTCLPGDCVHEEMALLHEAGLTNYEVLRSATFNPGLFVVTHIRARSADRFGVVAPGARADLLLLDRNPLEDLGALHSIAGVMIAGRWQEGPAIRRTRDNLVRELVAGRRFVDEYERIIASRDLPSLLKLLASARADRHPALNQDVVIADAQRFAARGNARDGIALLRSAEPLLSGGFNFENALGRLELQAGDKASARAQFEKSLLIAPRNGGGLAGLAASS